MKAKNSGEKTLLLSILMSAPGPLILALGLLKGQSSTQIADFVRRSAELLAILVAYFVYRKSEGTEDSAQKEGLQLRSNRFVGAMMCLGGGLMLLLLFLPQKAAGDVLPSFLIAFLGLVANSLFFRKYYLLDRAEPNPILKVQSRLYGAKSLVDLCVSLALVSLLLLPERPLSHYLDHFGSFAVSLYLLYTGLRTIREAKA